MAEIASLALEMGKCILGPLYNIHSNIANYNSNFERLRREAESMASRRSDLEQDANAGESRDQVLKKEYLDWVSRVKDISSEVDALNAAAGLNQRCLCGFFPNCRRKSNLSADAVELCHSISSVMAVKFDTVFLCRNAPIAPAFTRSATENFTEFLSTKTALEAVMTPLKAADVSVVGMYGAGGIGKTTAVKEAAARALDDKLFDRVVLVSVSKSPNVVRLQSQIALQLGLPLGPDYSCEATRASLIKMRILREKRVLIVLDDVWEAFEPEIFGVPKGSELRVCESKIIVTTRHENVCHRMGCQVKVKLDLWSVPDSWRFFKKTARTDFDSSEFEDTAKLVAKECQRLPLALFAVAKALGDKDEREWNRALIRMKNSMPPNLDDDGTVFKSLMLSFEFLDPVGKACFLVCCLFPEDHNVGKEELTRYLFGLGFFPHADTLEDSRGDVDTVAKKLIASGLLLDGDKREQVKMHDVFRDFAIQLTSPISKKKSGDGDGWAEKQVFMVQTGNNVLRRWPLRETLEDYTAISTMSNDIRELLDSPDCVNLHTLLLQDNNNLEEIPVRFFENMKALRLLDFSGIKASSLPSSTNCLKMLRTLYLDRCKFSDVSILGELEKLTILSLKQSIINELPEEIGRLGNLRLLDLTLCFNIESIKPGIFPRLRNLEELYLKGSFSHWRDDDDPITSQNACFSELVNLPRLSVVSVDIDYAKCLPRNVDVVPNWQRFNVSLCAVEKGRFFGVQSEESGEFSTSMILDTPMRNLPMWFHKGASKKTEKLTYSGCESEDLDLIEDLEQERLSGVKFLIIEYCKAVNHLIGPVNPTVTNGKPVFEALQKLQVHEMDYIMGLCGGDLPIGSLKNLKLLEVQQCPDLVNSLMASSLIKRTSNLEKIRATGSPVSEVFDFENLEEGLYLGSLKEIRLQNMYKLEAMWKGLSRFADFTKLKLVSLIKCEMLKTLFSVSIPDGLSRLEDLWIEECILIEEVVLNEDGAKLEKLKLPKLKTLSLLNLPKLTHFYMGTMECPSLEHIHVCGCPNFRYSISEFQNSEIVGENDEQHMKNLRKRMTEPEY